MYRAMQYLYCRICMCICMCMLKHIHANASVHLLRIRIQKNSQHMHGGLIRQLLAHANGLSPLACEAKSGGPQEKERQRERDSAKFNYTIHTIQSNQDQSISRIDIHSSRHSFLTAGQLLREQFDPKSILSVSRATAPLPCKT